MTDGRLYAIGGGPIPRVPRAAVEAYDPAADKWYDDTIAPTLGSLGINQGAASTTSATVSLTVTAGDEFSGLDEMSFSNDGATWDAWQTFATTASWTLAAGDGPKTIFARVRDKAGNLSVVPTAAITLDTAAGSEYGLSICAKGESPATTPSSCGPEDLLFTNKIDVRLTIPARPNPAAMQVSNDGGFAGAQWEPYASRKAWQITRFGNYVIPRVVYVRFRDASGAVSGAFSDDIILDETPPIGSVSIPGQAAASSGPRMASTTLRLSATDDVSGVGGMRLSARPDLAGATWQLYAASGALELAAGGTAYVQFRDNAGNVSLVYSTAGTALACDPRPKVDLAASPTGDGRLRVTVSATGTGNRLRALAFGSARNALIDVAGRTGLTGNATVLLAELPGQATFLVRRATAGAATQVSLTITDECGDWPSFVGGGPTAF